ncbi:MAG: hypothetical protein Q8R44_03380 [Novosphingobium sp.]|nr:hypothetical protein [Novosphingobium sp.]
MTSGPFSAPGTPPGSGRADFAQGVACATAIKWSALHDAAGVVAALAGLAPEPRNPEVGNFPALVRNTGGWRKILAEQGIDDLSAVMEPGIAALLAAHARGIAPVSAALALWHEFVRSRTALLTLVATPGSEMSRRA